MGYIRKRDGDDYPKTAPMSLAASASQKRKVRRSRRAPAVCGPAPQRAAPRGMEAPPPIVGLCCPTGAGMKMNALAQIMQGALSLFGPCVCVLCV
jgi:hypothetical protein